MFRNRSTNEIQDILFNQDLIIPAEFSTACLDLPDIEGMNFGDFIEKDFSSPSPASDCGNKSQKENSVKSSLETGEEHLQEPASSATSKMPMNSEKSWDNFRL